MVRLALFVAILASAWLVVTLTGIVDLDAVESFVDRSGPLAPVLFVPISAVLGAIFVPGPLLAGVSGYLFGTGTGTVVTLAAATTMAVGTSIVGRFGGRDGARRLLGDERTVWLDKQIARRGVWAVVGQRFIPGMPDAPCNYAFGALGMKPWQMAVGTLIGSAPRSFSYTAAGAFIRDPSPWLGAAATVVWVLMALAGLEGMRRVWARRRARKKEGLGVTATRVTPM